MISTGDSGLQVTGTMYGGASALRALVRERHGVPSRSTKANDFQEQAMFYARGSTLHSTIEFLAHTLSADGIEAVLSRLPADDRALLQAVSVTDDVPYRVALALWRSADIALAQVDPRWAERAGDEAIRVRGMQLYAGLIRKPTPDDFLDQHISLFQRYYRPGDIKVTARTSGRASVRLIGFEAGDQLFCRRLTGGWLAGIEISGARDPMVSHTRCVLEGDLFCEWDVRWK